MLNNQTIQRALVIGATVALCGLGTAGNALAQNASPPANGAAPQPASAAQAPADLSGTYQCNPNPSPCLWSGKSATISQSGNTLQIKGDNGAMADAKVTSPITITAGGTLNSLGIVRANKSIDWSDGTNWKKQ